MESLYNFLSLGVLFNLLDGFHKKKIGIQSEKIESSLDQFQLHNNRTLLDFGRSRRRKREESREDQEKVKWTAGQGV